MLQNLHLGPVHKSSLWALALGLLFLPHLDAQLSSDAADRVDSLDYPVSGGKVPLFAFYQSNGLDKPGSLAATPSVPGSYTFEWSMYNPEIQDYDPPFQTDNNLSSSSVQDLENGGYRVRITDGAAFDEVYDGWVWKNRLKATVNKNALGNLPIVQRTCDFLYLLAEVASDTVEYYDPAHDEALELPVEYRFKWTSDNPKLTIPNDDEILSPNISYTPPYEDTWYILTVTDSLGMVDVDSVFYESIQTKAEFSVEYWDKVALDWSADLEGNFDPDFEEGSTDARLTVRFLNHSKNGDEFHWVFLDTLGGIRETDITYDTTEMPEFTYINADKFYFPSLLSISEKGCEDSITIAPGIQVVGSQLEIPNYFSPTSSKEENRIWRFKHQSLKTCKISVFDRSGRVVYKQDISDIYEWEGWDGTIRDSKREAPPGAYYYVIEATGYDGVEYYQPSIWSQMKIFGGDGRVDNGQGSNPGNGEDTPGAGVSLTSYTGWVYLFRN